MSPQRTANILLVDDRPENLLALTEVLAPLGHNLVSDRSFNEFHVIFCRNVMIYFDRTLQDRVHQLLYDSLVHLGILAVGQKESIRFTMNEGAYEELDADEKIYRKVR